MSAYLICLTVGGGVPIFSRKHGELKQIPFPLLASLNGVAMFGEQHDVTLISAETPECKVLWREYHNSIRLILAIPRDTESDIHGHRMMDLAFQSMVLIVGLDELIAQRSIERLKRELRGSFGLIDAILSGIDPSDRTIGVGDLVGAMDVVVFPEETQIQSHLESFVESVDSTYGCVMINGKTACATRNWWNLHPDELVLLSLYIYTDNPATLRDIPVFLPIKSPTVPFRLISCEAIEGVTVNALCGPAPPLNEIQGQAQKHFGQTFHLMSSLKTILPRCFPQVSFDPSFICFMLINLEKRRVLATFQPGSPIDPNQQSMNRSRKLDILRTFYRNTVGTILKDSFIPSPHAMNQNGDFISMNVSHVQLLHPVTESFTACEFHKCMAMQQQHYQFFGVFIAAVPNHSMRNIAQRTLQSIVKDKNFNIIR